MSEGDVHIVLVAAIGENNVIGRDNELPWRIPSDLKHFRAVTIGKPVMMGRKTFESIGKPLKDRTNIVVTRDNRFARFVPEGVVVAHSIDEALALARADAKTRGVDAIMVIGGSHIFDATLARADRLEITHVHASPEGDVVFPAIDPNIWQETSSRKHPAEAGDSADFTVATYEKR